MLTRQKFDRIKAYYASMVGIAFAASSMRVDDITELFEALEQAQQERDNWENDARERQRNTEYYQSLLDEIGGHFGEAAFMRDDGAKSDSILRAKVPELVERLQIRYGVACEQRDAAVAELERMKALPCEGEFGRLDAQWQSLVKERDEAIMEGLRLTKLLEKAEAVKDEKILNLEATKIEMRKWVERARMLEQSANDVGRLRAHKEASEAVAAALQKSNALLLHAAPLIYRRHTMVSGSLEMAECDAACKAAGLDVWRWPTTDVKVALEPIDVLRAIEGNLAEASNLLQDERLEENERFELLDMEINVALREVQAWKEEAGG